MKRFIAKHSPMFILAGLCIVLAFISEDFRLGNLQNVASRSSTLAIVAMAEILVIVAAGIDLSVGSVTALSGVVAAFVMVDWADMGFPGGASVAMGLLAGCGVGMLCGAINGWLWAYARIPAFIATLGMMMVARGAAYLVSGGTPIHGPPAELRFLGGAQLWWIPTGITLGLMLSLAVLLHYTPFGRHLYAIGGNQTSARLSGVPVDRVRFNAFALSGLITGFAGCIHAARVMLGAPTANEGLELDAIAACVIGGASLMGGEGGVIGAVAGALIMKVLVNFCNLMDLDVYWQYVLVGSIIVALVYYDTVRKRRAGLLKE
jgi:ribose/xylose/arabinose/galactoside ABC-type transport system permease subunit